MKKFKKEAINFAAQISERYKDLQIGNYFSKKQTYRLEVVDFISDTKTFGRIGQTTNKIQIDKSMFSEEDITKDFVFFILLWCICKMENGHKDVRDEDCDIQALKACELNGASRKNILNGMIFIFKHVKTIEVIDKNHQRVKAIIDYDYNN